MNSRLIKYCEINFQSTYRDSPPLNVSMALKNVINNLYQLKLLQSAQIEQRKIVSVSGNLGSGIRDSGQYLYIVFTLTSINFHNLFQCISFFLSGRFRCQIPASQEGYTQSHYLEVTQGDIFMEQKMRFGLVLGRLVILKKQDRRYSDPKARNG